MLKFQKPKLFFRFEFGTFGFISNFACLREAPPCGAKAGISCFEFEVPLEEMVSKKPSNRICI